MKTIIYAGPFQMPDKNAAAHRVLNNGKIFRSYGFQVVFVGLNPEADADYKNTCYEYEGFPIYELRARSSFEKFRAFADRGWMEYLTGQYDVAAVIAYDYYAYSLFSLLPFCRSRALPLIADTDEWFAGTGKSVVEKAIRILDSELRMRLLQPKADGVIAISRYLTEYYQKKTCTVTIPPLVDKAEEKWQHTAAPTSEALELVYSGSPGAAKDKLDLVVRFVSTVKKDYPIRLTVIGVTREDFLRTYGQDAADLQNSANEIVFLGRIPHRDALRHLQRSDFSIFLRNVDRVSTAGFPTKFVESISAGVPVITNKTSDLAEYLRDGENGFLLAEAPDVGFTQIFQRSLSELKRIKANVQADMFHYERHASRMEPIVSLIRQNAHSTPKHS